MPYIIDQCHFFKEAKTSLRSFEALFWININDLKDHHTHATLMKYHSIKSCSIKHHLYNADNNV